MPLLNVPYLRQTEPSWCLPACAEMIAAYTSQPVTQEVVARWLGTTGIGTPASNTRQFEQQ